VRDDSDFKYTVNILLQMEYLLLCVVFLYMLIPNVQFNNILITVAVGVSYGITLIVMNHFIVKHASFALLSIKAILTMVFIGFAVWNTGKMNSPLLVLYLFGLISSALVLGKFVITMLVVLVIASLMIFELTEYPTALYTLQHPQVTLRIIINIFTSCLVAYLGFRLSSYMREAKEQIRVSAEIDYLTGLFNYQTFLKYLHQYCDEKSSKYQSVAILRLDIDDMKKINDKYGYVVGDHLLVLIAHIFKSRCENEQVVARTREDEYAIILPNYSAKQAYEFAEGIRSQVEQVVFPIRRREKISTTISIGVSIYPDDSNDVIELYKRAEMALDMCKDQGKNKVLLYANMFSGSFYEEEEDEPISPEEYNLDYNPEKDNDNDIAANQ
jgi:diguanylate cyclase (GGDEF)-like protein